MAFYHTACFVFVVMIACNAILYPSIFSTIFRQWFGGGTPPKLEKESVPEYPPHMRGGGAGRGGRMRPPAGGSAGGGRPPMPGGGGGASHDPTAFMGQGQGQQESRGRGMMGTVLPVYAVGIFIYFGYVIYKVFLRDKPSTPTPRNTWGYSGEGEGDFHQGPSPQRQQQEKLQRQLAAELKAANYPEFKKGAKKWNSAMTVESATKETGDTGGSTEEVDMLKKRLEQTEKTMERMMDMMNSMGIAMNQVSHHLATNDNPPTDLSSLHSDKNDDDDGEEVDIDVVDLTDEEDLLIGDSMEPGIDDLSSEEENDVGALDIDGRDNLEQRRPNKMNIVDVEADDYNVDDDGEVDSDDESEDGNAGFEDVVEPETLRRRNVKPSDCPEGAGIEG